MTLLTIQKDIVNEIIIERSRFICTLKKVSDEETATQIIKDLKKQNWDASHNCSAYIIGQQMQYQKSSDDGEPSGTAGIPMLEVLKKKQLHDVVAVVTRYFGGVKLGSGGLIRAYSKSVSEAINVAGIAKKQLMCDCFFQENIEDSGKVLNIIYQQGGFAVHDVQYEKQAKIILRMKKEDIDKIANQLEQLLSKKIELTIASEHYVEVAC